MIIDDLVDVLNFFSFWYFVWVILGIILVGIFIWKYWKFILDLLKELKWNFLIFFSLYIGGVLGLEMVGSYYDGIDG